MRYRRLPGFAVFLALAGCGDTSTGPAWNVDARCACDRDRHPATTIIHGVR